MIRSRINSDKDERVVIEFDDTTRAWNDWKHGNIIQNSFVHERFVVSLEECTKMYMSHNGSFDNPDRLISSGPIDIPSLVHTPPEISINCHICRKYQGQLYPCRICGKVYHQQCIKDIGDIRSYHLIKNATRLIGWSCPICEDLRIFLSPEELAETNQYIKSLGTQSIFNLDNYINTRIKSKTSISFDFNELNDRMKIVLQKFLNSTDDITSNRLSQIDLLILDVSLKLLRSPPKFLVNELTQFELYRLSQLFTFLSSIDNQCITYNKFHHVFGTYLLTTIPELDSDEKHSHSEAMAYSFLGTMAKFDRTWAQFVLDATIPTLLGRYNHRTLPDFINRIVSIKQSASSSTANMLEHTDGQSLSVLFNNVLQKLTQRVENESEPTKSRYKTKYTKIKKWTNDRIKR